MSAVKFFAFVAKYLEKKHTHVFYVSNLAWTQLKKKFTFHSSTFDGIGRRSLLPRPLTKGSGDTFVPFQTDPWEFLLVPNWTSVSPSRMSLDICWCINRQLGRIGILKRRNSVYLCNGIPTSFGKKKATWKETVHKNAKTGRQCLSLTE